MLNMSQTMANYGVYAFSYASLCLFLRHMPVFQVQKITLDIWFLNYFSP